MKNKNSNVQQGLDFDALRELIFDATYSVLKDFTRPQLINFVTGDMKDLVVNRGEQS